MSVLAARINHIPRDTADGDNDVSPVRALCTATE